MVVREPSDSPEAAPPSPGAERGPFGDAPPARPSGLRRFLWMVVPLAAVAAGLFLSLRRDLLPAGPEGLRVGIRPAAGAARDHAVVGDDLVVRADAGGAPHVELRIYQGDDRLVVRCADAPPCRRDDDLIEAEVELDAPGAWHVLFLQSRQPLPPASTSVEADAARARAAGAAIRRSSAIRVRPRG